MTIAYLNKTRIKSSDTPGARLGYDLVSGGMPDGTGNCYVLVPR